MREKKKDERANEIDKKLSEVRKKAIAIEQAKAESKRKDKEIETLRKRAKKVAKTMEQEQSYYENIIASGGTMEKIALLLKDYDTSKQYSKQLGMGVKLLSDEQQQRLLSSFKTDEERETAEQAWRIYHGALEYGKYIIGIRGQWQKDVAELGNLLTLWSQADDVAEQMTKLLPFLNHGSITHEEWTPEQKEKYLKEDEEYSMAIYGRWDRQMAIDSMEGQKEANTPIEAIKSMWEYIFKKKKYHIFFNYDSDSGTFKADITTGGLYSAIESKKESAIFQIQALKSAVEPFSDFLYSNIKFANGEEALPVWFIPEVIKRIIEYPDAVEFMTTPENLKYFAFRLRQRKEAGEIITPEEEKRAVIPDYNQEVDIPRHRAAAERKLRRIFNEFIETDETGE